MQKEQKNVKNPDIAEESQPVISYESNGEEGYFISQDQLRRLLVNFRKENGLTVETLAKWMDIDLEILQDYESGIFDLTLDAYRLMLSIYSKLNDDFMVKN